MNQYDFELTDQKNRDKKKQKAIANKGYIVNVLT